MGRTYGGRRSRVRIDARANVRAAPNIPHWRQEGWTDSTPNWYKNPLDRSYGGRRACSARCAHSGRCSRPARARSARTSARVQGWNTAQQLPRALSSSVGRAAKKIVAYSQTDTGARTSDPAQPNFCPTPD
jgi:hypothetical protein